MRCKCCDNLNARWWKDDFYCLKCTQEIKKVLTEYHEDDKLEVWYDVAPSLSKEKT